MMLLELLVARSVMFLQVQPPVLAGPKLQLCELFADAPGLWLGTICLHGMVIVPIPNPQAVFATFPHQPPAS